MTKIRKSIIAVLACVFMLALCAGVLAACANDTYTVTFMVRENGATGDWQTYTTVETNDDGSVTLPADPTVEGYTFRDWYTDEGCTIVFDETSVSGDTTVYALFAENNVALYITDGEGNVTQTSGSLAALDTTTATYEANALSVNLTFDGWYTNAAFTQKYSSGMDATALYGRYMAELTYDNGYEELYTELVTPGGTTTAPDESVDDFVKRYMDDEDISYTDSEGNAIDFTADTFDANQVITVLWKTPGLSYTLIDGTSDSYYVSGFHASMSDDFATYPAISVLSQDVTVDDSGTTGNVVAVYLSSNALFRANAAEVLIFNEGIVSISGVCGIVNRLSGTTSELREICLPSTLKVLVDSFNFRSSKLTEIVLPEGLEVLIDCFWSNQMSSSNGFQRLTGLGIDITVPSSVTNMSVVPNDLDLSLNDKFEYDEASRLYYMNGDSKILCMEYQTNISDDGRLVVEEGVTGVQVYLLSTLSFSYLDLPSTFREVGYNNVAEDYPEYTGDLLTPRAVIENSSAQPPSSASSYSYAIVSNLEELTYVTINRTDLPVSDYAFVSSSGVPHNGSAFEDDIKVVLIGEYAEDGVAIEFWLTVSYARDDDAVTQQIEGYSTGDTLTTDDIYEIIEDWGYSLTRYTRVITNVGEEYEGGEIRSNLYITVELYAYGSGFTYTTNSDGTATITGVDLSTAEQLSDGTYRIVIDTTVDGYSITEIPSGVFKGVSGVSEVYIANTVTTIGAEAFMNMPNLRLVEIEAGGLEVIGESAFAYAGSIQDDDGNWVINTDGGVTELTMILPLANLTEVGAYAFKTVALSEFTSGDDDRTIIYIYNSNWATAGLEENGYYYVADNYGDNFQIIKYMGISEVAENQTNGSGGSVDVTIHDAQLVAIAGGRSYGGPSSALVIGLPGGTYLQTDTSQNVMRYEVMEGSVYFISGTNLHIYFNLVKEVHENAFTDISVEEARIFIHVRIKSYDIWITVDQINDETIFENGWYEGRDNSENKFTVQEN